MAFNLVKKYDSFLEIGHFTEQERSRILRQIFDRDIADNEDFSFHNKIIRPLKKEDVFDVDSLFKHLTFRSEEYKDLNGRKLKRRNIFDFERSKRLHWILPHIDLKLKNVKIEVFSSKVRKDGKDVIRTFIYNVDKQYVIILEPQRSGLDYYFITAYYLDKKLGGPKSIQKSMKRKLSVIY
ncbi:hypothetical protein ACNKXS_03665 [Christiangramia marina]|uniref:hypothetical protein n=1 Tax=Christiangramia marina TaxID=409436 RepID=UPI003AA8093A